MKRFFLFLGMLALGLQASSYERYTDAEGVVWHFNINGTEAQIIDVYYYGDNKWKNNRWEKAFVKYWLPIPYRPEQKNKE